MKKVDLELIDKKISEMTEFSGVIKISKDSEVVYEKVAGFAEIANERLNNIDTRFGIASGAKMLTAISICKLVEQGKLKFDSLLKEYVDCESFDDEINIGHMLTHTSGLPDYFDEEVMSDFSELWIKNPMYLMREAKDFLSLMMGQKMKFKPGERFHYNNGAFVILAYIVEQVSGIKFSDYVQVNIFDVLKMNSSGYFRMDMLPKNCAYGYESCVDGQLKTNIYSIPIIGGGDGGVFVTANDISKLWDGLLNYKLLNKQITDELLIPHIHVHNDVYYGYGIWIIQKNGDIYKYYITGSDPGVSFESAVYPGKKLEVVILGNKEFSTYEIIKGIESYME